jgi:hypothetical protein
LVDTIANYVVAADAAPDTDLMLFLIAFICVERLNCGGPCMKNTTIRNKTSRIRPPIENIMSQFSKLNAAILL